LNVPNMNVLAAIRKFFAPPMPVQTATSPFHATLVEIVRLYSAAVSRGDVQAQRYYAVAMHALLVPSGVREDDEVWA
jgi:hypothetical protein